MIYPIKLFNNSKLLSLSSDYLLDYECLNSTQYGISLEIKLMVKYENIKNYKYCKIGEYYYIIKNIKSISKDRCKIEIETNNFLTHTINLEYLWLFGSEANE